MKINPLTLVCLISSGMLPGPVLMAYEDAPVKQASEIVDPVWLSSEFHTVEPQVSSDTMLYRFVIKSEYGNFEEYGTDFMKVRVREIHATAKLKKEFMTLNAAEGAIDEGVSGVTTIAKGVTRPVKTLVNIPKGIGSFVKRGAGAAEGNVKADGNYTGGPVRDWFGTQEQKLILATELGVDPYTDNELLNKKLNKIASSSTVGGLTLRILIPGDGLIAAADEGEATRQLNPVYETPPTKLYNENRTLLVNDLGISSDRAVAFLGNQIHSPAQQAIMIRILADVGQVPGVEEILATAETTGNRHETIVFRRCLELLKQYHDKGNTIARWASFRGYPLAVTKGGRLICPAYLDYVFWSERAENFSSEIAKVRSAKGASGVDVLLYGEITSQAKSQLYSRGINVIAAN